MGNDRENLREEAAGELRALLARRRISASQLGRMLGWKQSYMARRIDGRVALDLDDLQAIAAALDVPVAALLPRSVHERAMEPERATPRTTTPYGTGAERPGDRRKGAKGPKNRKPDGHPDPARTSRVARPGRP